MSPVNVADPLLCGANAQPNLVAADLVENAGSKGDQMARAAQERGIMEQVMTAGIDQPMSINPDRVVAADLNGDGWVDLVSLSNGTNKLTVLTNNGHGGFTAG